MAVMLLVGAGSVNAAEKLLWSGSQNTNVTVDASEIGSVSEGAILRIYFTIDNQYNWQFTVCPNGHFRGSYFANWNGANWGDDNGFQDCSNGYNTLNDASEVGTGVKMIELEMTALGAEALSEGLLLKINSNITAKKITLESDSGSGYSVKFTNYGSGAVTADKTEAEAGDQISLTIAPSAGYQLYSISATAGNNDITLSGSGNTRTFTMPAGRVTVTAYFVPIATGEVLWEGYFDTGSWQRKYISDNIFAGINEGDTLCVFGFNTSSNWQFELHDGNNQQRLYMNSLSAVNIVNANMVNYLTTAVNGNYASLFGQNFVVTAITLKAKQGEIVAPKHTLTISIDGQTTTKQVAEGATLATVLPAAAKTGYTFTAWNGLPSDGVMPASDLTVTAQFAINSYTITYYVDGVQYGDAEQYEYGAAVTPKAAPADQDGKVFSGWSPIPATMPAYNVNVDGSFDKAAEYVQATIGSAGYATFCSNKALDFSKVTALKAFIAKSVSSDAVALEQVTGVIAAGTGLILKGSSANIPVADSEGTTPSGNMLKGVITNDRYLQSDRYYVLAYIDGKAQFASTESYIARVRVGHAFLDASNASRGMRLRIIFPDDETTGIAAIAGAKDAMAVVYDLSGRQVKSPKPGNLYIINNKKVLWK